MKGIRLLLLFFPVAVAAELLHWGDLIIFASGTSDHPDRRRPGRGNRGARRKDRPADRRPAQCQPGQCGRLIITVVAISAGKIALVKASIIGSILGNLLFVWG